MKEITVVEDKCHECGFRNLRLANIEVLDSWEWFCYPEPAKAIESAGCEHYMQRPIKEPKFKSKEEKK
jgi:hypothetical protein